MAYERQIIHYDSDSTTFIADWTERAESAWFELLRQGGCGAGEVVLDYKFTERGSIEVGHYVVMAYSTGIRWYMGRVESIDESSPMRTVVNLYGMVAELGEVFPGGRGGSDIAVPHRYAKTDAFNQDPDWSIQTWDVVSQPNQVVTLLYQQYIDGATHIDLDPGAIEVPDPLTSLQSLVFRSQESALSIIRQLATIANNASWGVDANGGLFFKRMRTNVIDTFQEGVHLEKLTMTTDRSLMCNSLLITGDYVYDPSYFPDYYRYQGRWMQTTSVAQYGEIRRNIFLPWCRTNEDAVAFAKQFFRYYAWPSVRHNFTTRPVTGLIKPWDGFIKLWDAEGANYAIQPFDRIRVQFDQFVKFDIWMGFEEMQFPDWDQDLRWELPGPDEYPPPPPSISSEPTFTGTSMSSASSSSEESSSVSSSTATDSSLSSEPTESSLSSESSSSSSSVSESSSSSPTESSSGSSSGESSVETYPSSFDTEQSSSSSSAGDCPFDNGCCDDPIPCELTATFFGGDNCPEFDLLTCTLTHVSGTGFWSGTMDDPYYPGEEIGLLIFCEGGGPGPEPNGNWELLITWDSFGGGSNTVAATDFSCSPLFLSFNPTFTPGFCDGANPSSVVIEITE